MKVRQIMTKDLTSEEKTVPVRELIFILDSSEMPSVPIVDEEGKLIGVISEKDIIRAISISSLSSFSTLLESRRAT